MRPKFLTPKNRINILPVINLSISAYLLIKCNQNPIKNVYKTMTPSVVEIVNNKNAIGSGFIYKDYIITNAHVVDEATNLKINDSEHPIDIIQLVDKKHDVAILKNVTSIQKNVKACANNIEIGSKVAAIGSPFGLENSLSSGIISNINKDLDVNTNFLLTDLIQTDTALNPGNSGGPLVNIDNDCVIGMNTAILSGSGTNSGVSFAIPIETIDKIIYNYEHDIQPFVLGVTLCPDELADLFDVHGAIIYNIIPRSIAEQLGLQGFHGGNLGDIIIGINDVEIKDKKDFLTEIDKLSMQSNKIVLRILRNGDIYELVLQKQT